jgi:hypothetical protein
MAVPLDIEREIAAEEPWERHSRIQRERDEEAERTKKVCDNCPCYQRQFGVKLDHGFHVGDKYYHSMGLGICDHPERPRGLMPSYYRDCRDWSGTIEPRIRDVTPGVTMLPASED